MSYRRSDTAAHAGRLSDRLARRFGARNVFHDVTAIAPGENFEQAIDRALIGSNAELVFIGPTWLTASAPQGVPAGSIPTTTCASRSPRPCAATRR